MQIKVNKKREREKDNVIATRDRRFFFLFAKEKKRSHSRNFRIFMNCIHRWNWTHLTKRVYTSSQTGNMCVLHMIHFDIIRLSRSYFTSPFPHILFEICNDCSVGLRWVPRNLMMLPLADTMKREKETTEKKNIMATWRGMRK